MFGLIEVMATVAMAPPSGGSGEGGIMGSFWFPLIMIAFLFYFILYLPEKKRKAQREQQIQGMQRGDEIITAGGMYGKITALTDKTVTVEIAPNVRVKVGRQHITPVGTPEAAAAKTKDTDGDNVKDNAKDKDKPKDKDPDKGREKLGEKKSFWSRFRGEM